MIEVQKNVDITRFSAFKTPATAELFIDIVEDGHIEVATIEYTRAIGLGLPVLFLGSGTNCLFAFDHFPGLVIKNSLKGVEYRNDGTIQIATGEMISTFSIDAHQKRGITAYMPWVGLPGTVGGAVAGNAGCFGLEMKDTLISVEGIDFITGEAFLYTPSECDFSYRNSKFKLQRNLFLTRVTLSTEISSEKGGDLCEKGTQNATVSEMLALRRSKQPSGISCGSYYGNPPGNSAGRLIDEAGCKGMKIGGMTVSEIHGNFFMSDGQATFQDVLQLSEKVKEMVWDHAGIELHEEVRIIRPEGSMVR